MLRGFERDGGDGGGGLEGGVGVGGGGLEGVDCEGGGGELKMRWLTKKQETTLSLSFIL